MNAEVAGQRLCRLARRSQALTLFALADNAKDLHPRFAERFAARAGRAGLQPGVHAALPAQQFSVR
jgi:hypothetical protein